MAKKTPVERVKCIECAHSELMQRDSNPIIAKCPFLLYRQVANAVRTCNSFKKSFSQKEIKKF